MRAGSIARIAPSNHARSSAWPVSTPTSRSLNIPIVNVITSVTRAGTAASLTPYSRAAP